MLVIISCQTDETIPNEKYESFNHVPKVISEKITLNTLKIQHPKIHENISIHKKGAVLNQARTVYNAANDFYIDTSAILHLQYNDTHSYTFAIFRQGNSTRIENLVITEKINGEILAKIVSYNLTNPEKIAIQNNEFVNLSTKMSSTTVDPSTFSIQQLTTRIECHDEERQVVEACSSLKHDESNMELWHQCKATVKPKVYIILTTVCEDVSSGGGDNGGSSGLPGDSGAGSNTGGEPIGSIDDINDEPITTPLLNVSPVRTFIAGLNAEKSQWWNEVATTETKALLENYLNQNTVDNALLDEAEQFVTELIDTSIILNINASDIWFNDYENFRAQMSNSERSIFDSILPNRQMLYMVSAKKALDISVELFPVSQIPSNLHNGKGDAFRHALWNAYCTGFFGATLTEQLTTAHEAKIDPNNPFPQKEIDMDLYNNDKGRIIGGYSNYNNVENNVLDYLNDGGLRFLSFLNPNYPYYPTIMSALIPTDQ